MLALDPSSDTGSSNSDGLTNETLPIFTGTADVGDTVTLYDGATVLGTTTGTDATWSIRPGSMLGEGVHTVTATATDAALNVSLASAPLAVTIDTTAPTTSGASVAFSSDTGISLSDLVTRTAAQTIT